jgi:hypothetical protein
MTHEELLRAPVNIHAGRTLTCGISPDVADLLHAGVPRHIVNSAKRRGIRCDSPVL